MQRHLAEVLDLDVFGINWHQVCVVNVGAWNIQKSLALQPSLGSLSTSKVGTTLPLYVGRCA